MKKGLLLTLVVAVAMISSSVFAYAPVLKNLPDVIVGDADPGNPADLFVFSDAFVFDTYVTDNDSTISELKWSFKTTLGTQTVKINGLDEETTDLTFVNPVNDLRAAADKASFYVPTAPANLTDVYLAVYVSDGTFKDSEEIKVSVDQGGLDKLTGLGVDPGWSETWDGSANGWTTNSFNTPSGSVPAVTRWFNNRLECNFIVPYPLTNTAMVGYVSWEKVGDYPLAYQADTLYVLKTKMSADANDTVPQIRLRAQDKGNAWTMCGLYGKITDAALTPAIGGFAQTTPADFYMIWYPQGSVAVGGSTAAFINVDIYQTTTNAGSIYIDEMKVYPVPMAQVTTVETVADIQTFTGWDSLGGAVTIGASDITLTDTYSNGVFHWADKYVTFTNGQLTPGAIYRLKYSLKKTGTAQIDQIRLRTADVRNSGYNTNFVFNDNNTGAYHLDTTAKDFIHYHAAANVRETTGTTGDLYVALDQINTITTASGSLILDGLVIEKVELPTLN